MSDNPAFNLCVLGCIIWTIVLPMILFFIGGVMQWLREHNKQ